MALHTEDEQEEMSAMSKVKPATIAEYEPLETPLYDRRTTWPFISIT